MIYYQKRRIQSKKIEFLQIEAIKGDVRNEVMLVSLMPFSLTTFKVTRYLRNFIIKNGLHF